MTNPDASSSADLDWRDALKRLLRVSLTAVPLGLLSASFLVAASLLANIAFAILFYTHSGIAHTGYALAVRMGLAALLFVPFPVVALFQARSLLVRRLLSAALESQKHSLALLGQRLFASFLLQAQARSASASRLAMLSKRAWVGYLRARTELPWVVRLILIAVFALVPMSDVLSDLAARDVPDAELPKAFITEAISRASDSMSGSAWITTAVTLTINATWFGVVTAIASRFLR